MKVYNESEISEIYNCIVDKNYSKYKELEKYHNYFFYFLECYKRDLRNLRYLIELLDDNYDKIGPCNIEFINDLILHDQLNYGYIKGDAIGAFVILYNRKAYPFYYDYYRFFQVLFDTCKEYQDDKYKEVNKYREAYLEAIKMDKYIDEEKYRTFQYNNHVLVGYITSYCYYNNYEPEKIKDLVTYFLNNYEQLINIMDVNGMTREELTIDKSGLNYYIDYYKKNKDKKELKIIK